VDKSTIKGIGITFREQAGVARLGVLAQVPAIAKVVVALDELDAVAAGETELIGAPGLEFVCAKDVSYAALGNFWGQCLS
jgi:hypothetical protein